MPTERELVTQRAELWQRGLLRQGGVLKVDSSHDSLKNAILAGEAAQIIQRGFMRQFNGKYYAIGGSAFRLSTAKEMAADRKKKLGVLTRITHEEGAFQVWIRDPKWKY